MVAAGTCPGLLVAGLLALLPCPSPASAAEVPVDLELVLAVDVSGSMDPEEQRIQRAGYVAALTDPAVLAAVRTGAYGRVAIAYVEWAGPGWQVEAVPWRVIGDEDDAGVFAAAIAATPFASVRGTSISGALAFAAGLFDGNGYEGLRRVIDVSGDGANNTGAPVEAARDAVLAQGIGINGLPLMLRPSNAGVDLGTYYEECVIGGPGAFVLPVHDPGQLAEAIRRKLVLEIAGLPAVATPVADGGPGGAGVDCLIGERQRRMWADP